MGYLVAAGLFVAGLVAMHPAPWAGFLLLVVGLTLGGLRVVDGQRASGGR